MTDKIERGDWMKLYKKPNPYHKLRARILRRLFNLLNGN